MCYLSGVLVLVVGNSKHIIDYLKHVCMYACIYVYINLLIYLFIYLNLHTRLKFSGTEPRNYRAVSLSEPEISRPSTTTGVCLSASIRICVSFGRARVNRTLPSAMKRTGGQLYRPRALGGQEKRTRLNVEEDVRRTVRPCRLLGVLSRTMQERHNAGTGLQSRRW